mmetsp:Transcript_17684/g.40060  ORF Transcript_17684/g.40060 Transcript_17684/m.40060 type:complete len:264 (+) Transcript_17684:1106-1897(+)
MTSFATKTIPKTINSWKPTLMKLWRAAVAPSPTAEKTKVSSPPDWAASAKPVSCRRTTPKISISTIQTFGKRPSASMHRQKDTTTRPVCCWRDLKTNAPGNRCRSSIPMRTNIKRKNYDKKRKILPPGWKKKRKTRRAVRERNAKQKRNDYAAKIVIPMAKYPKAPWGVLWDLPKNTNTNFTTRKKTRNLDAWPTKNPSSTRSNRCGIPRCAKTSYRRCYASDFIDFVKFVYRPASRPCPYRTWRSSAGPCSYSWDCPVPCPS